MNNIIHSTQESKNRVDTVSLGKEAYNKLEELANENERSKSYFLKKALDNGSVASTNPTPNYLINPRFWS
jgi:hypothetical protein